MSPHPLPSLPAASSQCSSEHSLSHLLHTNHSFRAYFLGNPTRQGRLLVPKIKSKEEDLRFQHDSVSKTVFLSLCCSCFCQKTICLSLLRGAETLFFSLSLQALRCLHFTRGKWGSVASGRMSNHVDPAHRCVLFVLCCPLK